ncbi:MAG: hypothetical protein H6707_07410 [Deltaproteobacteria bacterium]|nr:hypothetical protein [Deltaproteobacteria bacterium]
MRHTKVLALFDGEDASDARLAVYFAQLKRVVDPDRVAQLHLAYLCPLPAFLRPDSIIAEGIKRRSISDLTAERVTRIERQLGEHFPNLVTSAGAEFGDIDARIADLSIAAAFHQLIVPGATRAKALRGRVNCDVVELPDTDSDENP